MKFCNTEILYWISTSIVALFLIWSAYSYAWSKATIDGVQALGFPDFFRVQLIVLKVLAAFCLMIPMVPETIKQWSYAGVGLFLLTAIVAHIAHKDPVFITIINLFLFLLLAISNYYLKV